MAKNKIHLVEVVEEKAGIIEKIKRIGLKKTLIMVGSGLVVFLVVMLSAIQLIMTKENA